MSESETLTELEEKVLAAAREHYLNDPEVAADAPKEEPRLITGVHELIRSGFQCLWVVTFADIDYLSRIYLVIGDPDHPEVGLRVERPLDSDGEDISGLW